MTDRFSAPWHKTSFDRFIHDRLPLLLASRVPLAGYRVEETPDPPACRVQVQIAAGEQAISLEYGPFPMPDERGVITISGQPYVVVPTASQEELDQAALRCIGEQLYDAIQSQMGQAPAEMVWDEAVARAFLPLDSWINDFLRATAQRLDTTNWHAEHTHLRRIIIPNRKKVIAPGQMGRVDPFETPEGPYIGRVFTIAMGAEIRDERLVIVDDRPEAALGPNAQMVPFLEHDDANRLLMGVNMMRQAVVPEQAEPALVQTGNEPEDAGADFWCGRNLLTAFIAWGEGSVEDGLILSESAARRLNYPYPAEIGDKLANKHGTKGVVSQVLPDAQMPHLPDGTPVEIVFSFAGLVSRLNFGQIREAVIGWIAQAEGKPAMVPPFHAPSEDEIRARLAQNGLPESGMVRLRRGKGGPELEMESTVGYVYWYRLAHLARGKLRVVGTEATAKDVPNNERGPYPFYPGWEGGEVAGDLVIQALIQAGALENAREMMTTRALDEGGVDGSAYLHRLNARLVPAGIALRLENGQLAAKRQPPEDGLALARPFRHPWLREMTIEQVGMPPEGSGPAVERAYRSLVEANQRIERWTVDEKGRSPETAPGVGESPLSQQLYYFNSLLTQVENRLGAYFDALLPQEVLRVNEAQKFSARAVIAPGIGLLLDQVGLPEDMARVLFAGRQGDIADAWVIVLRAPALAPTALAAFHPVIVDGPAIRLHPQASKLMNADFDGDLVSLFLPLSEAAQREAGERLSIAAHVRRSPALAAELMQLHETVWGLAWLSLNAQSRGEIAGLLGVTADEISAPLAQAVLGRLAQALVEREGAAAALPRLESLSRMGCDAASGGASLSPFPDAGLNLPPQPESDDPAGWEPYLETVRELVLSRRDFTDPALGPQLLSAAVRSRPRQVLPLFLGPRMGVNIEEQPVVIRHGNVQGFTPDELSAWVAGARRGLAQLAFQAEQALQPGTRAWLDSAPLTLLARARASKHPGIIFARAAVSGEVDPLQDAESRVLMGI